MRSRVTSRVTQRRRRRRLLLALLGILSGLALLLLMIMMAYQTGLSESAAERARLRADLQRLKEVDRILNEKLAVSQERLEGLAKTYAELRAAYAEKTVEGEVAALLELLKSKLEEGISAERLAFLLRNATPEADCGRAVETARLFVEVPLARGRPTNASLAEGRIAIRIEGQAARDEGGRPEAWFDPGAPVRATLTLIDGRTQRIEGVLPITHRLLLDDREYRIALQPAQRRGFVEVALQRCEPPAAAPEEAGRP